MKSHVIFRQQLDNDTSLNESIRERIEHNLKYNDDTIFDGLSIFQDIGETNNKVHGSKDKFNARSLLSTPIWEIPVSDEEEEEEEKGKTETKTEAKVAAKKPSEDKSSNILKKLLGEENKSKENSGKKQTQPVRDKVERSQ